MSLMKPVTERKLWAYPPIYALQYQEVLQQAWKAQQGAQVLQSILQMSYFRKYTASLLEKLQISVPCHVTEERYVQDWQWSGLVNSQGCCSNYSICRSRFPPDFSASFNLNAFCEGLEICGIWSLQPLGISLLCTAFLKDRKWSSRLLIACYYWDLSTVHILKT